MSITSHDPFLPQVFCSLHPEYIWKLTEDNENRQLHWAENKNTFVLVWCEGGNETQGFPPARNRLSSSATIQASRQGHLFLCVDCPKFHRKQGFWRSSSTRPKDLGKVRWLLLSSRPPSRNQIVYLTCKISKDKEIDNRQPHLCVIHACSHPNPQEAGARGLPGVSLGYIETLS